MAKPIEWIVNTRRKVSPFLLASVLLPAAAWAKTPVLLSTDVGNEIDDQWAIVYLLTTPDFDVQGIVSAHAPTLPDPSAHAAYQVLVDEVEHRMGMALHPPLLEGASLPLKDLETPQPSAGLDFILQTSKQYSKENRLHVLTIGAATDVACAILSDPAIVDRIDVVAMGFRNLGPDGGKEYNVENDPKAWQAILASNVPVTIGAGDVCQRNLSLSYQQAAALLSGHGAVAAWLWDEYRRWYFQHVKPLRADDFSKPWVIWDIVTLAYVEGITAQKTIGRPVLSDDLSLAEGKGERKIDWIEKVDSARLWKQFIERLDAYQRTHAIRYLRATSSAAPGPWRCCQGQRPGDRCQCQRRSLRS